jgi:hypothetical protein
VWVVRLLEEMMEKPTKPNLDELKAADHRAFQLIGGGRVPGSPDA